MSENVDLDDISSDDLESTEKCSKNVDMDDIGSDDLESTEKCSKNLNLDDISSDDLESPEKCSKVKKNLHFKAIFPYFDVPQVIFIFSKKDFYKLVLPLHWLA